MAKQTEKIVGFCCQNSIAREKKLEGKKRTSYEPAIRVVALPCSSKVETLGIIKAFESGADGVFVLGCAGDGCRMIHGNDRAARIVNHTKGLLKETGINSERLEMFSYENGKYKNFDQVAKAMTKKIQTLNKA